MFRRPLSFIFALVLIAVPAFAQRRGYLGVGVAELTPERVKALNLNDGAGVEVKRVEEHSAAGRAGIKENDIITEVNGRPVEDLDQFLHAIGALAPGTKVTLTIWRNGSKQTVTAALDPRPEAPQFVIPSIPQMPQMPFPGMNSAPLVGFEGEMLTPQLADFFGVHQGVLVRTVNPKTPAEKAGLKAGDVVTKVNGTPVTSPREITALVRLSRKKTVPFTLVRNHKEMSLDIELPDSRSPDREVL
jgi:serine protease Do